MAGEGARVDTEVLVVGAGPTGLVLAVWLARAGVRLRIIDKLPEAAPFSRALGVQARTLEFYRQLGIAERAVEGGVVAGSINLWRAGRRVARVPFADPGAGLTPYPYVLAYAQDAHERMLIDHLETLGVAVERDTELVEYVDTGDAVRATLRRGTTTEWCVAAYVAGCDGGHSAVRAGAQVSFPGGTYEHLFYVADVAARGPAVDDGVHVSLDRADLLAIFDMKGRGHVRLVGTVSEDPPGASPEARDRALTFDRVAQHPIEQLQMKIERVNWFSTYRVHHRVATRFRAGRAFLLGDAAHVHSPVGAQGMNTGIGDAVNLAWKLADVLRGRLAPTFLDTYETERIAFARRLVATTDRAFEIASGTSWVAGMIRKNVFPTIVSTAFHAAAARRWLFRTVSQLAISYRRSALSAGHAGSLRGGDRLPWAQPAHPDGRDNFAPLATRSWQVHSYGGASDALRAACADLSLELYEFPWSRGASDAGLREGSSYLVRPDGYIALADADGSAGPLREYIARVRP